MEIVSFGPWGDENSRNWSFRFFEGQVLKGFRIRHGDVVDGITFVLANKSSNQITSEKTVGGEGGMSDEVELDIASGEFITNITGASANYFNYNGKRCITSMTIYTNLNKNGYGPYGLGRTEGANGSSNVTPFSSPPVTIDAIVGFHGGANEYLDSIGIFINTAIAKLGPWGNEHSQNWSFQYKDERLQGIRIRHGYVVDAIAFGVRGENSVMIWGNNYGGEGGSVDEIHLDPIGREFVMQISGTTANYLYNNNIRCITSIKIHTNLNPNGYGPYGLGRKEGEYGANNLSSFSTPLVPDNAVIGFHGGANQYLESIGIFVTPMGRPTPR